MTKYLTTARIEMTNLDRLENGGIVSRKSEIAIQQENYPTIFRLLELVEADPEYVEKYLTTVESQREWEDLNGINEESTTEEPKVKNDYEPISETRRKSKEELSKVINEIFRQVLTGSTENTIRIDNRDIS